VIFVVDSSDKDRIDEASEELQMMLRETELKVRHVASWPSTWLHKEVMAKLAKRALVCACVCVCVVCVQNAAVLVFANKQDVEGCLTPDQLTTHLKLHDHRCGEFFFSHFLYLFLIRTFLFFVTLYSSLPYLFLSQETRVEGAAVQRHNRHGLVRGHGLARRQAARVPQDIAGHTFLAHKPN
jgi:hypothetical protein